MVSPEYEPVTGKPIDRTYLKINLPKYLQKSIDNQWVLDLIEHEITREIQTFLKTNTILKATKN